MASYHKTRRGLDNIDDDVTPEGLAVMLAEPSRFIRALIVILFALIVVLVAWSFYGRADVVVSARGTVAPEDEQKRVYVPLKGELVELYVAEGHPVKKGDLIARLNSLGAIQLAGRAADSKMALEFAERKMKQFPAKQEAQEAGLKLTRERLRVGQAQYDKLLAEGMAKLGEEQRLKLAKARSNLAKKMEQRSHALRVLEQHQRLIKTEGGGGISQQQVENKRKEYREKQIEAQIAQGELGEFEIKLGQEYTKKQTEIQTKFESVVSLENQIQDQILQMETEANNIEAQIRKARAEADLAARIRYQDIDENNFLRILAPADGVITQITQSQIGAELDEKTPLVSLAPSAARKILEVEVLEADAAFLSVGMPVKIKFNAFPYQKHGFIEGTLEYVAEVAMLNRDTKQTVYKARVGLKREYFEVNEKNVELRYGMAAKAELIIRQRRLVDIALDPIRKVTAG